MKYKMIRRIFQYYADKYNVKHSLVFASATSFFGQCNNEIKVIALSRRFVDNNNLAHIRHTILHELAHALIKGGHNKAFYEKCAELGIQPMRHHPMVLNTPVVNPKKYKGTCPKCGATWRRDRRPKGWGCGKCRKLIKWTKVN